MKVELEHLIGFGDTVAWRRRKAEQYPEDSRNLVAAVLLEKLQAGLGPLDGSSLHKSLEQVWLKYDERESDETWGSNRFQEAVGENLRSVGFGYCPADTAAFVTDLLEALGS